MSAIGHDAEATAAKDEYTHHVLKRDDTTAGASLTRWIEVGAITTTAYLLKPGDFGSRWGAGTYLYWKRSGVIHDGVLFLYRITVEEYPQWREAPDPLDEDAEEAVIQAEPLAPVPSSDEIGKNTVTALRDIFQTQARAAIDPLNRKSEP